MPLNDPLLGLSAPRRLNYYTGRLLTAADFEAEQRYHLEKRRLHNRMLHGAGVVSGLAVTVSGGQAHVAAGVALDCAGREIIVPAAAALKLPPKALRAYLLLSYAKHGAAPLPAPPDPSPFAPEVQFAQIEESYTLAWGAAPEPHSKLGRGWRGCGGDHGVPVARLLRARGRWRVDPGYRRPVVSGA